MKKAFHKKQQKLTVLFTVAALILVIALAFIYFSDGGALPENTLSDPNTAESGISLSETPSDFSLDTIPDYSGEPFCTVNGGVPYFTQEEITEKSFEKYSPLDSLDRCGVAFACVGRDLMPTEERESISHIKPTGWQSVQYDHVEGKSLYNRCHLIGFQLTGENANEKNLITGTRYLNVDGMLPFENMIADYVKETDNHVMYRVTPVFEGSELVARGVLMEGYSVEDNGEGISFNVFAYNVQPLITINYADGSSYETASNSSGDKTASGSKNEAEEYILNTSSKKFHRTDCSSAKNISEKNKEEFEGSREDLIAMGYEPCGYCKP